MIRKARIGFLLAPFVFLVFQVSASYDSSAISLHLVGLLSGIGIALWSYVAQRRLARYVRTLEYQVCLRCGYDLRYSTVESVCPECGTRFSSDHMRQEWEKWLRIS